MNWIIYGLMAAVLVAICDRCRKHLVKTISPHLTVLLPLAVSGRLLLIYLIRARF